MKKSYFLKRFVLGPLQTNCYLVADTITKDACLIDPGADPDHLKKIIAKEGLNLKFIVNTHGHGDHISANSFFNLPIFIHELDAPFLSDPDRNMSRMFMGGIVSPPAARLLTDGDTIRLGELEMKVLHTPGHTPGSISLVLEDIVFTGDTLFEGSVGRTDFAYGDEEKLFRSIRQKLLVLKDDTVIYPGHGESSTIGREKKSNPFIR